MNRFVLLTAIVLMLGTATFAQDNSTAAAIAARQEAAERDRLFTTQIDELRQTIIRQQRDLNRLANENSDLQRQINEAERKFREAQGNAVTRKDLEKVVEQLRKVDDNRLADKNLIIEQIKKVAEIAATKPAPIIVTPPPPSNPPEKIEKQKDSDEEKPALTNPHGYFTYKIKPKDNLTAIIAAYNEELKDKGKAKITLEQVKKANPKMNPNNLMVGREIMIPVPPDK